ncbi:Amino acid transporter, transmembrane [Cynara cardunculus var. scolymus]|uniref:Amino acid transporter, transmembrane n=1 Tax=Cynara cardunculus var. scolymus TaxID=59895 RepID=A0A103XMA6_CYNCS|nr:Amino acid transporter, transmembrane [Cynara cardunculus var. scolymus]
MHKQEPFFLEKGSEANQEFDDDGRPRRTGTWMSASAHIITAVVGSGVLSLTWCLGQLGWILGTLLLLVFAVISWFTCILLTNCYRSPDATRNYNYMQAVKANLAIEIILSQIPNFHKLSFLSIVATVMSFAYSTIGVGLSIAKIAGHTEIESSGEESHENGNHHWDFSFDIVLHAMWATRIRSIRQRRTWELLDWLRFLRAFLARRH